MHDSNMFTIDRRLLHQFLVVYDSNSVSRAADQLQINQSSVSHALERLRKIIGDPLFVRSGRGIAATERANEIAPEAREIVRRMDLLVSKPAYDPATDSGVFTIMANDYEIQTVVKPSLPAIRKLAPMVTMRIINAASGPDIPELLRSGKVDLVLNPNVDVDASDIKQKRLFSDSEVVFYDPEIRKAPKSLNDFCKARHAMLVLGDIRITDLERELEKRKLSRHVVLEAPTFFAVGDLIRGTDIIAAMPSRLSTTIFRSFQFTNLPVSIPSFSIMQMWHNRMDSSPRHKWFRSITDLHQNS